MVPEVLWFVQMQFCLPPVSAGVSSGYSSSLPQSKNMLISSFVMLQSHIINLYTNLIYRSKYRNNRRRMAITVFNQHLTSHFSCLLLNQVVSKLYRANTESSSNRGNLVSRNFRAFSLLFQMSFPLLVLIPACVICICMVA